MSGTSMIATMGRRRRAAHPFLLGLCLALVMLAPGTVRAAEQLGTQVRARVPLSVVPDLAAGSPAFFKVCHNQTYALCAVASCYVYNQVAYCKCDVKQGDSISLPFTVDDEDVCDVNASGPANGFMVSTFSLPDLVVEGGNMALYTCPGR